jgi:hypothetical protein
LEGCNDLPDAAQAMPPCMSKSEQTRVLLARDNHRKEFKSDILFTLSNTAFNVKQIPITSTPGCIAVSKATGMPPWNHATKPFGMGIHAEHSRRYNPLRSRLIPRWCRAFAGESGAEPRTSHEKAMQIQRIIEIHPVSQWGKACTPCVLQVLTHKQAWRRSRVRAILFVRFVEESDSLRWNTRNSSRCCAE